LEGNICRFIQILSLEISWSDWRKTTENVINHTADFTTEIRIENSPATPTCSTHFFRSLSIFLFLIVGMFICCLYNVGFASQTAALNGSILNGPSTTVKIRITCFGGEICTPDLPNTKRVYRTLGQDVTYESYKVL
jgi:hypothetical protein